MGIKGLTGYVAQRQALIGRTVIFGSSSCEEAGNDDDDAEPNLRDEEDREQLIIDGSAFCYRISRLHLDWTKGGECATLKNVLSSYIQAFRSANLNPVFVWDGVFDTKKLETVKSRIHSSIRNVHTYFRSSPTLRTHKGFKNENHLLPQIQLKACVSHIRSISEESNVHIEQHFPGGEADFIIANLAVERNAYILSQDSDFFITSHGCRGYIPLDSLQFVRTEKPKKRTESVDGPEGHNDDDGGDWGQVVAKSRKKQNANNTRSNILGNTVAEGANAYHSIAQATHVHCKVYTAQALAQALSLPSVIYLPLCGILAGNDYYTPPIYKSSPGASNNNGNSPNRFAAISSSIVRHLRKARKPLDREGLPEFIRRIIDDIRDFAIAESMISEIAGKALATLPEYCTAILASKAAFLRSQGTPRDGTETPVSISSFGLVSDPSQSIHPLHALLLPPTVSSSGNAVIQQGRMNMNNNSDNTQTKLRIYNAFENGYFRNTLLQIIVFATFTPPAVLEDPDRTSCVVSLGRPLRGWIYAILDESVGIGRIIEAEDDDCPPDDGHVDAIANGVNGVNGEESEEDVSAYSTLSEEEDESPSGKPKTVLEYVRRNAALAEEDIIIPAWESLDPTPSSTAPPLARSTLDRFHILLHATSSSTEGLKDPNNRHLSILSVILAVRHIASTLDGTPQAWSVQERKAALLMASVVAKSYEGMNSAKELLEKASNPDAPVPNEYMQRAAQITTALLSVSLLIEALLLTPLLSTSPETLYQGSLFSYMLDVLVKDEDTAVEAEIMEAVGMDDQQIADLLDMLEEGLPIAPSDEKKKNKKNGKKKQKDKARGASTRDLASEASGKHAPVNKFAMLAL